VVVSNWWRFQNHVETAATVEQVLDETISQLGAVKAFCRYRRVVGLYFQEQDLQIVKNNLAMLLLSTEGVSISITRRVTKKEIEMREKAIIEGLTAA
jgi:DNA-directed RNA polymerase subunit N (RpoN/RPB10)